MASMRVRPSCVGRHLLDARPASCQRTRDRADVVGRDVDADALVGLVDLAVDLVQEDLRAGDLELEALAPHLLDEHGQLQLAAAAHLEGVRGGGGADLDADVAEHLALQPGADLPGGQELAVTTGHGRGVDAEGHAQRGLVHGEAGQRARVARVRDGVPDGDLRQPGHGHDVPGAGLLDLHQLDAARGRERGDRAGERDDAAGLHAAVRRLRLLPQHA